MLWRRFLVIPVLFFAAILAAGELPTIAGHWEGKITLQPGIELGVLIDFQEESGVWKGDIDIPVQAAKDLPLTNITLRTQKAGDIERNAVPKH